MEDGDEDIEDETIFNFPSSKLTVIWRMPDNGKAYSSAIFHFRVSKLLLVFVKAC